MVGDHTNQDEANHKLAKEAERYRKEVSKGRHGPTNQFQSRRHANKCCSG